MRPSKILACIVARSQASATLLRALADFEIQLTDNVQFLLDAILSFIDTDQLFKVVAIVVDIPPTLIASMYGMNFGTIHEYSGTTAGFVVTR